MSQQQNQNAKEPILDIKGYTSAIEKIVENSIEDCWHQYININRHQAGITKTYMWLSIIILGFLISFSEYILTKTTNTEITLTFNIIGALTATAALGVSLFGLPGRHGYRRPCAKSWVALRNEIAQRFQNEDEDIYPVFLTNYLTTINNACEHNHTTNQKRAKFLRATSWILLSSYIISIVSLIIFLIEYKKVIISIQI